MLLFRRRLQHARVGKYYRRVFITVRHLVYHDAIQHAGLHILLLHIQVTLRYAVIKYALGYLQFRAFLLHRHQQAGKRHVGIRSHHILKIERPQRYEDDNYDEMPAALIAVSSLLSPRFPKVMSAESNMARGRACGTRIRAM